MTAKLLTSRYFGRPVRRAEDETLLAGGACFLADLKIPDVVEACFVRSPNAHALIRNIDLTAAVQIPGVLAIYASADLSLTDDRIPCLDMIPGTLDVRQHALARDRVRYVGEPVCIVIAADRYIAEDATEAVVVEYEPLASVTDGAIAAAAADGPLLYPELGTNIVYRAEQRGGDVEAAFAGADILIEKSFHFHRHGGVPMETRGVIAVPQRDGRLHIHATSQIPQMGCASIATALGVGPDMIRFVSPRLGGGFGVKEAVYPEEIVVAAAARKSGRAVRWIEDRPEHFVAAVHAREEDVTVSAAVTSEGIFTGLKLNCVANIGAAFGLVGNTPGTAMVAMVRGPYRIEAIDASVISVVTNKTPLNVYRGAGAPQAALVMERLMDLAAEKLGIDRVEIRRRNMIAPTDLPLDRGDTAFAGVGRIVYDEGDYPACLEMAVAVSGYDDFEQERLAAKLDGRLLGLGISFYVEITAVGPFEKARLRLDPSGRVTLFSGIIPMGQGSETTQRQIVAEELGIDIEQVVIVQGDTDAVPVAIGTFASRGAAVGGAVAQMAAQDLKAHILSALAQRLNVAPETLAIVDGRVVGADLAASMSFQDVMDRMSAGEVSPSVIEGTAHLPVPLPSYAYACHIAVVSIDPATGKLVIPRYVVAHDCGIVANPLLVEGQIVGGLIQGLGGILREKLPYDVEGRPMARSMGDYVVPGVDDLPFDIELLHLETPTSHNPLGMRGVGEGGATGAYAAVANAIADALRGHGDCVDGSGPYTPARIWAALRPDGSSGDAS